MTQNPDRKPLAPGEIRKAAVNGMLFQVMHVAGGSFTQAIAGSKVICTSMHEDVAVRAYADAIAAAEAADSDVEEDGPQYLAADGSLKTPGAEQLDGPAAEALSIRAGFADDATGYNLPLGADMNLVTGETDDPAVLLAIIRDALFRHVPGGGEQYLDRYLMAVAERVAELRAALLVTRMGGDRRDDLLAMLDKIGRA